LAGAREGQGSEPPVTAADKKPEVIDLLNDEDEDDIKPALGPVQVRLSLSLSPFPRTFSMKCSSR